MPDVLFNNIPGNLLVPFSFFEINSGGTPYEGQSRLLLQGQINANAPADLDEAIGPISSTQDAIGRFGEGSMLVEMYDVARRNAPFQPIWCQPQTDPVGGVKATATITVTTVPNTRGPGRLWIGDRIAAYASDPSMTPADLAARIRSAINGLKTIATATVGTAGTANVVTVTARHPGTLGNDIYVAHADGSIVRTGHAGIVAMSGGLGVPNLAFANLGDDEYDWIGSPYAGPASLNQARDFLSDSGLGRWGPMRQLYGHYITASPGTLSSLVTLGNGRNDRHASILGTGIGGTPTQPHTWAAALAAKCAQHLTDAPELSRPLQTLQLMGVTPALKVINRFDTDDRQALYVDGISAFRTTPDGRVLLDRIVTTEQVDLWGTPDATFRDIETMAQMMFVARYFRTRVNQRHGRQALADENPFKLPHITTPDEVKRTLIHCYTELCQLGVLEKPELFARVVQVLRDQNNATRLNAYLPVDAVNQLRVFAANITTYLQYRAEVFDTAA